MRILITVLLSFLSFHLFAQKAQFQYDQAKIHYDMMEYDDALVDITNAIEKKNKYYDAYLLRAQIYIDMDNDEAALKDLNYLIENFETSDQAHFYKGVIFYYREEPNEAIKHFNKAIELYDKDPNFYYYQGETYLELDSIRQACTAWNYGSDMEGEDCKEKFAKNCDGVELIVPEQPKVSNPFEGLFKK